MFQHVLSGHINGQGSSWHVAFTRSFASKSEECLVHGHGKCRVVDFSQPEDARLSSIDGLKELVVPEDNSVVVGIKLGTGKRKEDQSCNEPKKKFHVLIMVQYRRGI